MISVSSKKRDAFNNINVHFDYKQAIRSTLFHNVFSKLFEIQLADTPEKVEDAHRIRYKVFCEEHEGYERPEDHKNGLELDTYDDQADHALLIFKPEQKTIGTVRVIRPNESKPHESFPMQKICNSQYLHDTMYINSSCEFSRLCISNEIRGRIKDDLKTKSNAFKFGFNSTFKPYERPLLSKALGTAPLGLISGAFDLTVKQHMLNVFGIMEPKYINRLEKAGLVHQQIGPEIEYHGRRTPFLCNVLEVLENAADKAPEFWSVVSNKGKMHSCAKDVFEAHNLFDSQIARHSYPRPSYGFAMQ